MPPQRRASEGAAAAAAAAAAAGGDGGGGVGGPAHRHCFLQAVMARQFLREDDAKDLYRQITGAQNDAFYFHFVGEVNQQLEFARFELRRAMYLADNQHYLGFVNKEADEASKRSVKYRGAKDGKPDTRITAYFRALLERIATSATAEAGLGYLSSRQALNLSLRAELPVTQAGAEEDADLAAMRQQAEEVSKLGLKERETALAQLSADGWLAHMPGKPGCYTLGPRSFLELGRYILALDLPPATAEALQGLVA